MGVFGGLMLKETPQLTVPFYYFFRVVIIASSSPHSYGEARDVLPPLGPRGRPKRQHFYLRVSDLGQRGRRHLGRGWIIGPEGTRGDSGVLQQEPHRASRSHIRRPRRPTSSLAPSKESRRPPFKSCAARATVCA